MKKQDFEARMIQGEYFHEQRVSFGAYTVIRVDGRMVALEVKTYNGKLSHAQSCWLESVRKKGGVAAVVRSVEDAFRVLDEATCKF